MEQLTDYWPLAIILFFLGYRQYRSFKFKKLLPKLIERKAQIVDVRSKEEFESGHNPISKNFPIAEFDKHLKELNKGLPVIVCCATGARSALAKTRLKSNGFEVYNAGKWVNTLAR